METKTAIKTRKTSAKKVSIGEDAIRFRAQEIYLYRVSKGEQGDSVSDWLKAEAELK